MSRDPPENKKRKIDDFGINESEDGDEATLSFEGGDMEIDVPSSPIEPPSWHSDGSFDAVALNFNGNQETEAGGSLSFFHEEDSSRLLVEYMGDEEFMSALSHQEGEDQQESRGMSVGRDNLSAMNPHSMNHWANAEGLVPIVPGSRNSSGVASRPVNCPSESNTPQRRGDGSGYGCPICGKKTKDCDKRKCLLPFSVPRLFRAKNGVLYYFRGLEDVLRTRKTQNPGDGCTGDNAVGKYFCTKCKKPKLSEYHKKYCLYRPGILHRLAADGETMMIGFPIQLKAGDISNMPSELRSVLKELHKELSKKETKDSGEEGSQNDDGNGDKKPAAKKKPQGKK